MGPAPVVTYASAPVFVGAISTASAPSYSAPVTASAPTYYVNTLNTTATASAPSTTTATTASAPTPTIIYLNPATGTASAPGTTASAPESSTLSATEKDEILEDLRDFYKDLVKDTSNSTEDRRNKLLEEAKRLVAEATGVAVDDLKAADATQAGRLARQARRGSTSGEAKAPSQGTSQVQGVVFTQATSPAYASYQIYPLVPVVPVIPVKPCGHQHFCLCKTAYP